MGFFDFLSGGFGNVGGGNLSPSTSTAQTTENKQQDDRRVSTANGDGSFVAQDGGNVNITTVDGGALGLAGSSVDQSLALARQIATTLGASVGNFASGATGSIDGLASLVNNQQKQASTISTNAQTIVIGAVALVGIVAYMAMRKRR